MWRWQHSLYEHADGSGLKIKQTSVDLKTSPSSQDYSLECCTRYHYIAAALSMLKRTN